MWGSGSDGNGGDDDDDDNNDDGDGTTIQMRTCVHCMSSVSASSKNVAPSLKESQSAMLRVTINLKLNKVSSICIIQYFCGLYYCSIPSNPKVLDPNYKQTEESSSISIPNLMSIPFHYCSAHELSLE